MGQAIENMSTTCCAGHDDSHELNNDKKRAQYKRIFKKQESTEAEVEIKNKYVQGKKLGEGAFGKVM